MNNLYIIGALVAIGAIGAGIFMRIGFPPGADPYAAVPGIAERAVDEALLYKPDDTPEPPTTMNNTIDNNQSGTNPAKSEDGMAPQGDVTVILKTNKGDIGILLLTTELPVTAGNFLKLAQENFYDGVKFHRVIDGFMIQGGDPLTKDDAQSARWGSGGPGYTIEDEWGPGYSNTRGTLSMANAGPNTGGSQFFINTSDNTFLDGKHPVFGHVVSGMEVIDAISKTETGPRDVPVEAIIIEDIVVQ